ncbi:hypothetical protein [Sphingopyxis phage VSN-002]|nr:hypothetical protein [Sphingopyxis phage VSN-002]
MSGWIYFIANGETEESWVKIGYTTGSVETRRRSLQTGCPFSLNILAFAPGEPVDERRLHDRFAAYRGYGEWFSLEGSLSAYVHSLMTSAPPMQAAPTLWTDQLLEEWPK